MFFVIGSDRKTRVIGPVEKRTCSHCNNTDFWELHELRDYVSIFFIPVIPYRTNYLLVCPICRLAREVDSAEVEPMRAQAERNLRLISP